MSIIRILALVGLLGTSALAEGNSLNPSTLPGMTAAGASVATSATLPAVSLPEEKRHFALVIGVAAVLFTFHRAFARRQRA